MSKVLFVDITSLCNLRCSHCYNGRYRGIIGESFQLETFFLKIKNQSIRRIHILGGEPLISPNLFLLLDYAEKNDIMVSINTNGVCLTKELFEKLSLYKNLDQITISLDGGISKDNDLIRGRGVFAKVITNLQTCEKIRSKIQINIACVVTNTNLGHLEHLIYLPVQFRCLMISTLFNEGSAVNRKLKVIDYEGLFQKLGLLIQGLGKRNIQVLIDLQPLPLFWLSLLNKKASEPEFNTEDCTESKLFYSATNRLYVCNPSSFKGAAFEITKRKPSIAKVRCKRECCFQNNCLLCEIRFDQEMFELCDYVINVIDDVFDDLYEKEIIPSADYTFVDYNGNLSFINFKSNYKVILCSLTGENPYKIGNYYESSLYMDRLRYKTIIAALVLTKQIKLKNNNSICFD